MKIKLLFISLLLSACSSTNNKPNCIFYCTDKDKIPESCNCLENIDDTFIPGCDEDENANICRAY